MRGAPELFHKGLFDLRCLRPARYSAGDCPPRVFRRAGARALPFERPQQKGMHDETGCRRFRGGEVARGVPQAAPELGVADGVQARLRIRRSRSVPAGRLVRRQELRMLHARQEELTGFRLCGAGEAKRNEGKDGRRGDEDDRRGGGTPGPGGLAGMGDRRAGDRACRPCGGGGAFRGRVPVTGRRRPSGPADGCVKPVHCIFRRSQANAESPCDSGTGGEAGRRRPGTHSGPAAHGYGARELVVKTRMSPDYKHHPGAGVRQ